MPENIKPTENFLDSRINYTPKPVNPFKESVERKAQQTNAAKEKYNTLINKAQNDPNSLTPEERIVWNKAIQGLEQKRDKYLNEMAKADNFQEKLINAFNISYNSWRDATDLNKTSAAYKIIENSVEEFYNSKKAFGNVLQGKLNTVDKLIANKDYKGLYDIYNTIQTTRDSVISNMSISKFNKDPKFVDQFDTSFSSDIKIIADALKVSEILQQWAPNTPTEKIYQSKDLLNNIGMELSKEIIGSSNYGGNNSEALFKYSRDKSSQGKMLELDMVAVNAIQAKDQLALVTKKAQLARLALYNKKSSEKIDPTKLEEEVKQLEQNVKSANSIDIFKYAKTNYPDYHKDLVQHSIETMKAYDGNMLEKASLAVKSGVKGIYNNYMDLGAFVNTKLHPELASDFRVLNQTLRYDKVGYVIGFDEKNKPVESTQFYWKDSEGKRHYNGYSIISSGLPVAEQMLKTIVLAEATGGLLGGLGKMAGKLVPESVIELGAVKSIGGLLKNPSVTGKLNTFSSVYLTTYPSMYFEELKNFKNPKDAEVVAKARAIVESLTESIIPNTPDLFKIGTGQSSSFLRSTTAAFDEKVLGAFPGVSSPTLKAMFNSRVGKRLTGISKDLFQEGIIEEEASLLGNHIVDKVFAETRNMDYESQNDITWDNIARTAIESIAGMLLTAGFMGGGTKRSDTHEIASARFEIANNPEIFKSWIKSQIEAGEITREDGVERLHKIDTYASILKELPVKIESIRDIKTLIEDKDLQLAYFTKFLEKSSLVNQIPTEEQKEQYDKELENIDKELYKIEKKANVYDNLTSNDKDVILAKAYFDKFKEVTSYEDLSPEHLKLIINAAKEEANKNANVKGSQHLNNYVKELENVQSKITKRFANFLLSNNDSLTFEQLAYKRNLLDLNRNELSDYYYNKISNRLNIQFNKGVSPLMEIDNEETFIEALAKNYVTAKEKEIPLTTNGKSLIPYISELYVNDGLFTKFTNGLSDELKKTKTNQLREAFFNRVKEIKAGMKSEETFPEVPVVTETPEVVEVNNANILEELLPAYNDYLESEESEDKIMNKATLLNKVYALNTVDKFLIGLNNIVDLLPETERPLLSRAIKQLQEDPTNKDLELYDLNFGRQLSKEKLQGKIKELYNIEEPAETIVEPENIPEVIQETASEVDTDEEREIETNNIITQATTPTSELNPTSVQMTFVDSINTSGVEESIKADPNIRMMNAVMDKMVGINPSESSIGLHTMTASIGFIYGKIFDADKIKAVEQSLKETQAGSVGGGIEAKKADIEIGKVGNTEYEVKVDGVYYQGKKLNNPENKTHRQLIEADIERRRQEELDSIGQKAVQRRLQDLKEAVSEKQIAQAIINIEKNAKRGAKITKEEQDFVTQKKQELKDKGFEIVDHTGKIWNIGLNLEVLNFKILDEGTNLTQEEIDVFEKELENRKRKKERLKEKGLSEQEIDNQLEDTISVMTTVQPQLNKDGKMVQAAKVDILKIEVSQAEEILERSKKNPKNTQQARENKINAKYDAELKALEQQPTPKVEAGYKKPNAAGKIKDIKDFKDGVSDLSFENFVNLFSINDIPVHDPNALKYLYKNKNLIGKPGEVFTVLTDKMGKVLFFNINGELDEQGAPFITTLSYKNGAGKEMSERIKESPNLTIISPVTKLTNGVVTHSQIPESSEIMVSQISEERQGYSLKKGVAYVFNKNNAQRPYEHIILQKNTPDSAKLLVQTVNAFNANKLPKELQNLSKTEFIAWFKSYAYLANKSENRNIDIDIVTAKQKKDGTILPERIAFRKKVVDGETVKWLPLDSTNPEIATTLIEELTNTYRNINNELLTSQDRFPQLAKFPHIKMRNGKATIVVYSNYKKFITSTDFGATVVTKSNRTFVFDPVIPKVMDSKDLELLDIDELVDDESTEVSTEKKTFVSTPPSEDDLYSIAFNNEITEKQNKAAQDWVSNHPIFKNTKFIFDETIKHPFAYAKWSKAAIELFNGANYGEAYHEAWHEFTQYYLTPEDKRNLYSQASNKYNSDDILFLEEKLAEEFRDFALNQKVDSKFKKLFNQILDFIKSFIGEKKTIDRYFQVLYRGNFQGFSKSDSNLFYDKLFSAKKLTIDRIQPDGSEITTTLSYTESAKFLESFDSLFVKIANDMYNPLGASFVNTLFKESSINKVYDNIELYLNNLVEAGNSSDITMEHLFNFERLKRYHRNNSLMFADIDDYISQEVQTEEQYNADNSLSLINKATNEISQKENAPQIIINMIRVLPKIEEGVPVLDTNFNIPVLGAFDKNWKILQKNLNGLSSYKKMYKKIEELSSKNPQFKSLLLSLPKSIKYKSDLIIKNNFYNLFSQPFVPSLIINYNTGAEFKMSPRFSSSTEIVSLRTDWANTSAIYTGDHKVYNPKTETYNFNLTSFLEEYKEVPTEKEELFTFLDTLGFKFNPVAFDTIFEDRNQLTMRSNLQFIYDKIKSLSEVKEISPSIITDIITPHKVNNKTMAGQTSPVNELLQYELNTREDSTFDMHENAAGDKTYAFNPSTYISLLTNALNDSETYPTLKSLYKDFPQLNPKLSIFTSNSYFLDRLFNEDGSRKVNRGEFTKLELIRHNGITIDNNGDKLIESSQSDKMMSDIKGFLDPSLRVEEINRLGDKSTTNILRLSSKDILWDGQNFKSLSVNKDRIESVIPPFVIDILMKYLQTEISFVNKVSFSKYVNTHKFKKDGVPRLGFFDQMFSDRLKAAIYQNSDLNNIEESLKNEIVDELTKWFNARVKKTKKIIAPSKPSEWGFNPNELNANLFQYHILSFISRMEQFKLFFGHPFYYKNAKDVEKRLSAWNASGTFPVIDKENNTSLQDYNTGEKLFHKYANKLNWDVSPRNENFDELPYLVFEDTNVESKTALEFKDQYGIHADTYISGTDSKKQDAAAIATIDFIKKFYSLSTGWTDDMQREYERQMKIWELLLENKSTGKQAKALEAAINEKPHYIFNIKKLQYAGIGTVANEVIPVFHKYSVAPLLPSIVVSDNKAFDILSKLYASSVDYGVFESGTKISETTTPVKLFNQDGEINRETPNVGKVLFKYLKEQQVVENKKSLQTIFATQFRKLAFKDLTENSEKELFEKYKSAIKELVDYDIAKVLDKFDSAKTIVGFILNELETKNISNSTKDNIRLKKSGELEFILDAFLERNTIESAVISSLKNKIIKQKYYGNQVVQYPTSLYRPSRSLKFYRKDRSTGKVLPAETIVQFNKKYYPLLTLIGEPLNSNGEPLTPGTSLRILNKKLSDKNFVEDNIDALTIIGVRIPTQGLNSMEHFQIVEFLPEEAGEIILVPDEMVIKSGSDYDIDKLFIYQSALNNSGRVISDEKRDDVFSQLKGKTRGTSLEELQQQLEEVEPTTEDKRLILQNKVISIMKDRLSQEEIFNDLIEPNNVDDIDRLAKSINYVYEKQFEEKTLVNKVSFWSNVINPNYQAYVFELNAYKKSLGIDAKSNTFQAMAQDAKLEITNVSFNTNFVFPHNQTDGGNISLHNIYNVSGQKISNIINQFISGHVDIMKNDNIALLNYNNTVTPVGLYMIQTGVPLDLVTKLALSPLVVRYSKGEDYEELFREVIGQDEKLAEYIITSKEKTEKALSNVIYKNVDAFMESFDEETSSPSKDLLKLVYFLEMEKQSKKMSRLSQLIDYDTDSPQNFEYYRRKTQELEDLKNEKIFSDESLNHIVHDSLISPFRINDTILNTFSKLFPITMNSLISNTIIRTYEVNANRKSVDFDSFSRKYKNALMTSILATNVPEIKEYVQYMIVDNPNNIAKQFIRLKNKYPQLQDNVIFSEIQINADPESRYLSLGLSLSDLDLSLDIFKEQFRDGLNFSHLSEEENLEIQDFFRIFAYTGILSTQLNKTRNSYINVIPEELFTPIMEREINQYLPTLDKEKLKEFESRFMTLNPELFKNYTGQPNPNYKFFKNYDLSTPVNIPTTEIKTPVVEPNNFTPPSPFEDIEEEGKNLKDNCN